MKTLSLAGKWICTSKDGTVNKEVMLPGSSCENGIGKKQEYYPEYCKEAVRAPREKYEYIGVLDYTREIEIPEEFGELDVSFFFERINIASHLFFDGIEIGRGIIGLSTPHVYRLTDRVDPEGKPLIANITGKHRITLSIDNSNLLNLGDMASGYSIDTQGYWNGCIGKMELRADVKNHVESVSVFKEDGGMLIKTVLLTDRHRPMEVSRATLEYEITAPDGSVIRTEPEDTELYSRRQRQRTHVSLPADKMFLWDEFDTSLYEVKAVLRSDAGVSEMTVRTGLRDIRVNGRSFAINGNPLSLRGTINCAQYPLTGYPPMDRATWKEHFAVLKEYGLNHVRFHAWCPPEAAFEAADELGLYLAAEMPLWLNRDISPMEFGDDEWHSLYFRDEAVRISEAYGNHPSFTMFSNGNENMGDYAMLETISDTMHALDPRRIYAVTSNFDHPLNPSEDYMCAFEILHNPARIQFIHDKVAESSTVTYDDVCKKVPVPFTSFEVGQYCIYPDVDICERYTGNMLPVNFDVIRKEMKKHGVYHRLGEYIKASGDLAAKLYKEDIEAVLRTPGMGGFQLLAITDYTGQSTATVGILDVMFKSKDVISAGDWRRFCSPVVPLFLAKREFLNTETMDAELMLYDHGKKPVKEPVYELTLKNAVTGEGYYTQSIKKTGERTSVTVPLSCISDNAAVRVTVGATDDEVCGGLKTYENSWTVFVYSEKPGQEHIGGIDIPAECFVKTPEEYERAKLTKGRYIITPEFFEKEQLVKNSYIPVFWSPVHFPSEAAVGYMIDEKHQVLEKFPTEKYTDYQWKTPIENSVSVRLKELGHDAYPIVEAVPNYTDNEPKSPLCVFNDKEAEFLFCGFDLTVDTPGMRALKKSISEYLTNQH